MSESEQDNMHSEAENFLPEDTNAKKSLMEKINLAIRITLSIVFLTVMPVKEVNAGTGNNRRHLKGEIETVSNGEEKAVYSKNIWRKVRRDWYKKLEEYGFDKKERKIKLTENNDEFIITVNAGKYTETRTIDNTGKFKDIIDIAIGKMLEKIQKERLEDLLKKTVGMPNYNNKNTNKFRIGDVYGVVINRDQAKYIINVINGRAVYGFGNNTADALGEIIKKIKEDPSAFKISRNAYRKTRNNYKKINGVNLPFNGDLIHDEEEESKNNYLMLARVLADKNIPLSWFKDTDITLNKRGSGYIVTLVFKDDTKIVGTSPLAKVALIRAIDELYKHKEKIIDGDKAKNERKKKIEEVKRKEKIEADELNSSRLAAMEESGKKSRESLKELTNSKIKVSKLTKEKEVKKEIIVNLSRDERDKLGKKLPKEIRGHSYCVSLVSALIKFGFKNVNEAIDSVDKVTIDKSENTTTVLLLKSGQKITASINTTRKGNAFRHPASLIGDAHSSLLKKIEGSNKEEPAQKINSKSAIRESHLQKDKTVYKLKISEKGGKWRIKFKIGTSKYRKSFESNEDAVNFVSDNILKQFAKEKSNGKWRISFRMFGKKYRQTRESREELNIFIKEIIKKKFKNEKEVIYKASLYKESKKVQDNLNNFWKETDTTFDAINSFLNPNLSVEEKIDSMKKVCQNDEIIDIYGMNFKLFNDNKSLIVKPLGSENYYFVTKKNIDIIIDRMKKFIDISNSVGGGEF